MGLITITGIFTSLFTVISLLEIWRLRLLKTRERGKRPQILYPALLIVAAFLAVLLVISGSEAAECGLLSDYPPAASDPVPLAIDPAVTANPDPLPLALDPDPASPDQGEKDLRIGSILHLGCPRLSSSLILSVEEEYNDNIYQDTNASGPSDFITRIKLDMTVSLSGPLLNFKLNYQPEQILFSRHADNNELRHEFIASLDVGTDKVITLIRNLAFLEFSDTLTREAYHPRREPKTQDFLVRQITWNELMVHPYIKKNLTRTNSLECGYEYTNTAYSVSQATDRESHAGSLILKKLFSRKLEGNISYRLTREFAQGTNFRDYSRQEAGLGLSGQVAPSLRLAGTAGYGWLAFNRADKEDKKDEDKKDKDEEIFWSIDLDGVLPHMKSPTIFYRYETSCQNSIDSGALILRRHSLGWDYQARVHITWSMFSQKEDYQEEDWTDESLGTDASLIVPVHRRLDLTLSYEWVNTDYEPDGEKVRYHSTNTGIRWRLSPHFQCAAGYRYSGNDSNIEMNDYRNNVTYIRVSMEL